MIKNNIRIYFIFILGLSLSGLTAQNAFTASSGDINSNSGSVSYSIGQLVYSYNKGSEFSIYEGVQQAYEISIVTSVDNTEKIDLVATVFPNPSSALFTLIVDIINHPDLEYKLYDSTGKHIFNKKIDGTQSVIDLSGQVPAIYFLVIIKDQRDIKTFKIVKR